MSLTRQSLRSLFYPNALRKVVLSLRFFLGGERSSATAHFLGAFARIRQGDFIGG
jgi:hypothetical protein